MRCRAFTNAGTRCTRAYTFASWFCGLHQAFAGVPATEDPIVLVGEAPGDGPPPIGRRQPAGPVPYEVVAIVLRNSALPIKEVRTVATEMSEALAEVDPTFLATEFLRLALP